MPALAVRSARTRRHHTRSASWLSHVGFALGTLKITQDGKTEVYSLSPIASDYGVGVRFEKFGAADGDESYEVLRRTAGPPARARAAPSTATASTATARWPCTGAATCESPEPNSANCGISTQPQGVVP
jgi:hypothetical protein